MEYVGAYSKADDIKLNEEAEQSDAARFDHCLVAALIDARFFMYILYVEA